MKPPVFTETKLKELLHYTDQPENPTYDAFKSNAFFKIYSGAKGVSKSFGRMIETVYRIVNEKNFCSVWCRNQYNHIKNTLKPMLERVLSYLADVHNLNFKDWFYITNEAAYWKYDDGGIDRAIYFQNWEKIQAFQGFTLKDNNFRFGELVIDEPLEDVNDSNKLPHQLAEIYEIQEAKLPMLINSTIMRDPAPDDFQINVTFLYNIFTTEHFLIKNYHQKVIPLLDEYGNIQEQTLQKLLEKNFIQVENLEFEGGLGLIVTMFTKYFVPQASVSEKQWKMLDSLKAQNYRLWIITVAGFASQLQSQKINYFMKNVLFDETGSLRNEVYKPISLETFFNKCKNREIIGVYHGFDMGIHDNAAFCSVAITNNAQLIVLEAINDIKTGISKNCIHINKAINKRVAELVKKWNNLINEYLPNEWTKNNFIGCLDSIVYCDHNATIESLNILFEQMELNSIATPAIRKPNQKFGIVDRQIWQKNIFENGLVYLLPGTEILLKHLAKQVILVGDESEKRDETINKEIYDLINAFEMACSVANKQQYQILMETAQERETTWQLNKQK